MRIIKAKAREYIAKIEPSDIEGKTLLTISGFYYEGEFIIQEILCYVPAWMIESAYKQIHDKPINIWYEVNI